MTGASRASRPAAILSCLLCLPFALLVTLLVLQIEPNFGPLEPLLASPDPDTPDVGGSLVVLTTFVLMIVAFVLNLIPLVRAARHGGLAAAHPANLVLATVTLATILFVIGAAIVDQYPCWIGVPNCD